MLRAVHIHICKPLKTCLPGKSNAIICFVAFECHLLTISGHDAQGHEGIASNQLVVVCNEYTERIQSPKAQKSNLVLIS